MSVKIAFGHKARVGKDHAAEYLCKRYGGTILRFSSSLYSLSEKVQTHLNKPVTKDPLLLQILGQSLKTVYGNSLWINCLENQLDHINNRTNERNPPGVREMIPVDTLSVDNIYITDLRFPEEAQFLKSKGFTLVRIDRPSRPIDRDPTHLSEIALDRYVFDHVIVNDSSLEDFEEQVNDLYKMIS